MKRIEGMEELFLRSVLIGQKLNVINQKDVHIAVQLLEAGAFIVPDGVDEVISEVKAKKVKSLKPNPATEASKDEAPKTDAKSDKVDQPIASETLTPMAQAKLRIEALEKLETVEAVEKALEGETAKSVKKAGEAKIEALKAV